MGSHSVTCVPPGRGDIPAFTPAEAGTRSSDATAQHVWNVVMPRPIITKFGITDYVGNSYSYAPILVEFGWVGNSPQIGEIQPLCDFL